MTKIDLEWLDMTKNDLECKVQYWQNDNNDFKWGGGIGEALDKEALNYRRWIPRQRIPGKFFSLPND